MNLSKLFIVASLAAGVSMATANVVAQTTTPAASTPDSAAVTGLTEEQILAQLAADIAAATTPEAKAQVIADAMVANPKLRAKIQTGVKKLGVNPAVLASAVATAKATVAAAKTPSSSTSSSESQSKTTAKVTPTTTTTSSSGSGGGGASGG